MQNTSYLEEVESKAAAWADLKNSQRREQVLVAQAIGIEYFKLGELDEECLKLDYKGYFGYLPISFIDNYEFKGIQSFVGKYFEFVVSYIDLDERIFAADRIKALSKLADRFWKIARPGDVVPAFVRGVDRFNIYLLVSGVPVIMPKREYSYTFFEDIRDEVFLGDTIDVKITTLKKPNPTFEIAGETPTEEEQQIINGHVEVSSKALEVDPMTFITHYKEKCTYLGKVTKVHMDHGLFINLLPHNITVRTGFPPGTNGFLIKEGQEVNFKIQEINVQERRIKGIVITPQKNIKRNNRGKFGYGR